MKNFNAGQVQSIVAVGPTSALLREVEEYEDFSKENLEEFNDKRKHIILGTESLTKSVQECCAFSANLFGCGNFFHLLSEFIMRHGSKLGTNLISNKKCLFVFLSSRVQAGSSE